MALEELPNMESFIRLRLETHRCSYRKISEELNAIYHGHRGLSERSVRRFCKKMNINKISQLSDIDLDQLVNVHIGKVSSVSVLIE